MLSWYESMFIFLLPSYLHSLLFSILYIVKSFKIWLSEHGASQKQMYRMTHRCNSTRGMTSCLVTLPSSLTTFYLAHWVLCLCLCPQSWWLQQPHRKFMCFLFFIITEVKFTYNKINYFKVIQWHVVHSPCCTTNLSLVPEHFHHPKGNPVPIKQLSPILPSPIS